MKAGPLAAPQVPEAAALADRVFGSGAFSAEDFEKCFSGGPYDCIAVSDERGALIGFLLLLSTDVTEILEICTAPEARRRGAAEKMLSLLPSVLEKRGTSEVLLEVREGNAPARRLYEKHGFSPYCVRKAYYADPTEDAVLMRKEWGKLC